MRELVIYGSGGHARETAQLVEQINAERARWSLLGFLDDAPEKLGNAVGKHEVLGDRAWLSAHPAVSVVVAIGNNVARWRVARALNGATFATLIHPTAIVGDRSSIGAGAMISANCLVSCDVRLGEHVILNFATIVAHDSVIGDFSTLAPQVGLAGATQLGEGVDMGIGSTTIQGKSVGPWSIVGAGAVVTKNIPENATAVGIPARVIRTRPAGWHEP